MKILLVDDDEQVTKLVTATLTAQNYTVDTASDGIEGWELICSGLYDLLLLDVMLPKLDGISLCQRMRSQKMQTPVILLTARDTSTDKIAGLDAGADDYLVKPLDLQELIARIRALLRRGSSDPSPILEWGQLQLNPATLEVTYGKQLLSFRRKEFAILELFMRNKQRVFSRSAILDQLWSFDEAPTEDTIKAHIKAIRQQLRTVKAEELIETLYGQGYRLNPAYATTTAVLRSPAEIDPVKAEATRSLVSKIWQKTKGVSFDRLAALEQALQALKAGTLDDDLHRKAAQNAHKLHGSLGMFGFAEGSHIAKQIEMLFDHAPPLDAAHLPQLNRWVTDLHQFLKTCDQQLGHTSTFQTAAETPAPDTAIASPIPPNFSRLLIIDGDRALCHQLELEAARWKLQATVAPDLTTARAQILQNRPDVILLDLSFCTGESGLTLLEELAAYRSQIPVVVFTEGDRFDERVAVARLGGHLFLQKPTNPPEVMRAVAQVLQQAQKPEAKILAVDDDPQILLVLKTLLEPWGFQLIALENSRDFWDTLKATQPDLVMLDVEMPEINGIELCQAIRSDPCWSWLPILFLTAHTGNETTLRVYEAGADDYIAKPVVAAELISRILNRLERTRLLRSQTETDPITGVMNRQRSSLALENLLELAKQTHQSFCMAVLEVDHLKQINALNGHAVGERILRQIGQGLKQKLRSGDVVGFWGGAEFVVVLYGVSQRDGIEWLAESLEEVRSRPVASAGEPLPISFSAGVVQYPSDGTDVQMLYRSADTVLYQAKKAGGDRVLPFGWYPSTADGTDPVDVTLIHPESDFASGIIRALETRGYHTRWFKSAEALTVLTEDLSQSRSTVFVLGGLSNSTDFHLLKSLSAKLPKRSRIIALLSQADQAATALQMGATDYIVIPCSIPIVMQHLRKVLEAQM